MFQNLRIGLRGKLLGYHDVQNELLEMMAHKIQRDIASDVQDAMWFSLIIDETNDISVKEQVSICLTYMSDFSGA